MKKILFLIIVLFFGALLYLSTKQTDYNIENKYKNNRVIFERNKKYFPSIKYSFDKFNVTQKVSKTKALPVQTINRYSSRNRKGKIVYIQK